MRKIIPCLQIISLLTQIKRCGGVVIGVIIVGIRKCSKERKILRMLHYRIIALLKGASNVVFTLKI
jgi:hypothetical protein